ncbi:uncharacterized protein LOC106672328 [Cimex lectularius]|uniref:Uncharacterized protein n=1 Tax=Cimex lectularius TaxID=79782 RepID=A0A8I6S5N1_CIMLE|nr:uncharacterized protein LOC106672328 [Cimex lectularius]
MLQFWMFLLSIGTALAGVPYHTSYSAGVGYNSVEAAVPPPFLPQLGYAYSNVYSMPRAVVANAPHVVVAPPVETYTAAFVPAVEHHPAEASVNVIDIHHPKVSTRKFEIRRPAIEKQFYDIEERIVVRPAGKAVVELEQPVSKHQRGPAVVSSISAVNTVFHPLTVTPGLHTPVHEAGVVHTPVVSPTPSPPNVFLPEQPQHGTFPSPQENFPQQPENDQSSQFDDSDSVTIENAEIANVRSQLQQPSPQPSNVQQFQSGFGRTGPNHPANAQQFQSGFVRTVTNQPSNAQQFQSGFVRTVTNQPSNAQQFQSGFVRTVTNQPSNAQQFQSGFVITGANQPSPQFQFDLISQHQHANGQLERRPSVELFRNQQDLEKRLPSGQKQEVQTRLLAQNDQQFDQVNQQLYQYNQYPRTNIQPLRALELSSVQENLRSEDVLRQTSGPDFKSRTAQVSNQERLIDLLTARGGVTEVRGYGEGASGGSPVRARVLSVTASPRNAELQDEKVSTRRVVVNRPITTVEEVDVIEPFTKVERVAVNQPALIKTSAVNVPTVPVQHYAYTVSPLI